MDAFALEIMEQKYAHDTEDGNKETWGEIALRVASNVLKAVHAPASLIQEAAMMIAARKFIPGGRYLYAAGRPFHQVQNCLLLKAEDSREGWADLMQKITMALMTGAGIGIDYSLVRAEGKLIRRTGGTSTGPLALMQMVNEAGRGIMQGGARRSAIWAGLNWKHPDIFKFIHLKDWIPEVRELKEKDFSFPATMDMTNISVLLDDEFFAAYRNERHGLHQMAHAVYWEVVRQMLKTSEPGFSIDIGENAGETLRNAPVCGDTHVLTDHGYRRVADLVDRPVTVWTGRQFADDVVFTKTVSNAPIVRVEMTGGRVIRCEPNHEFLVERWKGAGSRRHLDAIVRVKAKDLQPEDVLHVSLTTTFSTTMDADAYTLGYMYGDGSFRGERGEITFCTDESKECVPLISSSSYFKSVTETDSRGYTRAYFKSEFLQGRNKAGFPEHIYRSRPSEIASFIAGLFDADGNYEPTQNRIRLASKHKEFLRGVARALEQLGILAGVSEAGTSTYGGALGYQLVVMGEYNTKFHKIIPTVRIKPNVTTYCPYRQSKIKVQSVIDDGYEDVFCADVKVPEHSFMAEGVIISNCTEITSSDDSDICNLGSINLAQIHSLEEMKHVTEVATKFLLAGTVYSDVPYAKVDMVRQKNRRIGLGLMGIHEWLLVRGKRYDIDDDLDAYLEVYARTSTDAGTAAAKEWDISCPVKFRAIAPTGSIGILAETSTGIEPFFCAAKKRRFLKHKTWAYQYVIDPAIKRLVDSGVHPDSIEDAYTLAEDVERRIRFQAHVQRYVDHAISSTINLPPWGSETNNDDTVQEFGTILMRYLPQLRGVTCYPDGARGGQPIVPVKYSTAMKHLGQTFTEGNREDEVVYEAGDVCDATKGGTCGS